MSFLFPTLLWIGLPLIAVPVIIHLLHRGRQERIPWAAMQFLVESQRKYQRWINLKQFLLLLARMAVVGIIALLVAQPLLRANWAAMFSQSPVQHVVLLDDSFSMTDKGGQGSAWSSALAVLDRLVGTSVANSRASRLLVLRFSDAISDSEFENRVFESDLNAQTLELTRTQIAAWKPSETNAQIAGALEAAAELLSQETPQSEVVFHVLSDFRRRDWQDMPAISKQLESIAARTSGIELVQCAETPHENLAISDLAIDAGVEAADVEVWFRLSVRNFGSQRAERVAVDLVQDGRQLTAISLGDVAPGETVTKRFRTTFAGEGDHWLATQLEPDAIEIDNARYYAAQLPANRKVLIVDGTSEGGEAPFLATALAPGGRARTGWEAIVETPSGLARYADLSQFSSVILLSVPRLPNETLDRLEDYVRHGGGVWITTDDTVDREYYNNELYRDGKGLIALPIKFPSQLEPRLAASEADLTVSEHPAMRIFSGARNDYLTLAQVQMFYETRGQEGSVPPEVEILATLRNGAPWLAEKRFGKGIAITHFSRLSPIPTQVGNWSNLAANPAFPVLANEVVAHLARSGANRPLYQVGDRMQSTDSPVRGLTLTRIPALPNVPTITTAPPLDSDGRLGQAGLFQVQSGQRERLNLPSLIAVNVIPSEGELAFLSQEELKSRLADLDTKIQFWSADELTAQPESVLTGRLADFLIVMVLGLLVGEQALAYWSSYHRRQATGRAA